MGVVAETAVTLRYFGQDLDPDEVTRLLGSPPTHAERRGERLGTTLRKTKAIAKRGGWRLRVDRRQPGDLDAQIAAIFSQLTGDMTVWRSLSSRYDADLFCGLFLECGNEGIQLASATLEAIAQRGLRIDFDIYSGDRDR